MKVSLFYSYQISYFWGCCSTGAGTTFAWVPRSQPFRHNTLSGMLHDPDYMHILALSIYDDHCWVNLGELSIQVAHVTERTVWARTLCECGSGLGWRVGCVIWVCCWECRWSVQGSRGGRDQPNTLDGFWWWALGSCVGGLPGMTDHLAILLIPLFMAWISGMKRADCVQVLHMLFWYCIGTACASHLWAVDADLLSNP